MDVTGKVSQETAICERRKTDIKLLLVPDPAVNRAEFDTAIFTYLSQ